MVMVDSVSKRFKAHGVWLARRRQKAALTQVSLRAEAGSVVAILGPNGSGKTTLLKIISAMLLPDDGSVCVGGYDTRRHAGPVRRQVGLAINSERSFFGRLTARENLEFFAALENLTGREPRLRVAELMCEVGLDEGAGKLVREFSSGMYQRLAIARALLKRPAVLLLDEASRSLDPSAAESFWRLVRAQSANGTAVIMATHNFEEAASVAGELLLLKDGMLVAHRRVRTRDVSAEDVRAFYSACIGSTSLTERETRGVA